MLVLVTVLVACGQTTIETEPTDVANEPESIAEPAAETGPPGMGPGSGMMARHHATIPEDYAGLTNPIAADDESLARGVEIYSTSCATCHGDGGMGDGPAGANLDPPPSPVAHTSQMLGDNYLFWRMSEGGAMAPFDSAMPAWKEALDEQARWDVVNYMRALGRGQIAPRHAVGGASYDPEAEEVARAEMLTQAVELNVITQEEADLFSQVHSTMDDLVAADTAEISGGMADMRETILAELVRAGEITQAQADAFNNIHDRLIEAGLMQ